LDAEIVHGSVLSLPFEDESFDHIINPCSLNFIEDLDGVYSQFYRVLRKGGSLIFGISNPILYIFNDKIMEKKLKVKYTLPFSDTSS
ncbi:class I SAM-dependent methyltransferase, partial [Salmonella enterica]|uniref:class I SAM-dependent methyltransferase n=1 Tax=Salmonella enterica TaxID=28901 RepID=UPI0020C24602